MPHQLRPPRSDCAAPDRGGQAFPRARGAPPARPARDASTCRDASICRDGQPVPGAPNVLAGQLETRATAVMAGWRVRSCRCVRCGLFALARWLIVAASIVRIAIFQAGFVHARIDWPACRRLRFPERRRSDGQRGWWRLPAASCQDASRAGSARRPIRVVAAPDGCCRCGWPVGGHHRKVSWAGALRFSAGWHETCPAWLHVLPSSG